MRFCLINCCNQKVFAQLIQSSIKCWISISTLWFYEASVVYIKKLLQKTCLKNACVESQQLRWWKLLITCGITERIKMYYFFKRRTGCHLRAAFEWDSSLHSFLTRMNLQTARGLLWLDVKRNGLNRSQAETLNHHVRPRMQTCLLCIVCPAQLNVEKSFFVVVSKFKSVQVSFLSFLSPVNPCFCSSQLQVFALSLFRSAFRPSQIESFLYFITFLCIFFCCSANPLVAKQWAHGIASWSEKAVDLPSQLLITLLLLALLSSPPTYQRSSPITQPFILKVIGGSLERRSFCFESTRVHKKNWRCIHHGFTTNKDKPCESCQSLFGVMGLIVWRREEREGVVEWGGWMLLQSIDLKRAQILMKKFGGRDF